jgi:hypothetical protein
MKTKCEKILLIFICLFFFLNPTGSEIHSANPGPVCSSQYPRHELAVLAPKSILRKISAVKPDEVPDPEKRRTLRTLLSTLVVAAGSKALSGCAAPLKNTGLALSYAKQSEQIKAVTARAQSIGIYTQAGGVRAEIFSSVSKYGGPDFTRPNYIRLGALLKFFQIQSSLLAPTKKIYLLNESEFSRILPEKKPWAGGAYFFYTTGDEVFIKITDDFISDSIEGYIPSDFFRIILAIVHEANHCYDDNLPEGSSELIKPQINPGRYGSMTETEAVTGECRWYKTVDVSLKNAYAYRAPQASTNAGEDSSYTVQLVYDIIAMLTSFECDTANPDLRDEITPGIERIKRLEKLEKAFEQLNGKGGDVLVRKIESIKNRFPPSGYAKFLKALTAFKSMPEPEKLPDSWRNYVYSAEVEKILERFVRDKATAESISEWTEDLTFRNSAEKNRFIADTNKPDWLFQTMLTLTTIRGSIVPHVSDMIGLILLGREGRKPLNDKLRVLASLGLIANGDTLEKAVTKMESFFDKYAAFNPTAVLTPKGTQKYKKGTKEYYNALQASVSLFLQAHEKKSSGQEISVSALKARDAGRSSMSAWTLKKYGFLKELETADQENRRALGTLGVGAGILMRGFGSNLLQTTSA